MSCEETMEDALNEKALEERLARIGEIFIVLSGKGGVGKSTVAANLALSLSMRGMRTGILDVDIHGPSIPKLLGLSGQRISVANDEIIPLTAQGNLKVVSMAMFMTGDEIPLIWRGPMKAKVIRELVQNVAWGDLDCLVVDCPPGTGDEPLSVAQLFKGKASAVVVTTPQQIATIDVEKCITFCRQLELPIAGIVENMSGFVCPDCGKTVDIFSSGGGQKLADRFGVLFLGKIPLDPDIVKSGDEEKPYLHFYSETKTAQMFDEIIDRIVAFRKNAPTGMGREAGAREATPAAPPQDGDNAAQPLDGKEDIMKFAVPTNEGKLCQHFGHCEAFALIDTDQNGNIVNETYITPPPHEPGLLPPWLSGQGVNCIIAGGMGSRAQQLFAEQGVSVVTGALGEIPREVVENYLKGTLLTGVNTCDH